MTGMRVSLLGLFVIVVALFCVYETNAGVGAAGDRRQTTKKRASKSSIPVAKQSGLVTSKQQSPKKRRVIVYIENRNWRIAIHAGSRYTVTSKNGKVLLADVTSDELKARYPKLHEMVEFSYASVWAGL